MLILKSSDKIMAKGIHGNEECVRCGACCLFYLVRWPDERIFKAAGIPCRYLSYESAEKKASCLIHSGVIQAERPPICDTFHCSAQEDSEVTSGLKKAAEDIPSFFLK